VKQNSILTEADSLVYGDRSAVYGDPVENHERIAAMWSAYLGYPVSARQVALCMALVKISRDSCVPKRDNLVDGAAYMHIGDCCGTE
jgi:hypothetical protein